MEARQHGPIAGRVATIAAQVRQLVSVQTAILGLSAWFSFISTASSQYGPAPIVYGQPPMTAGYGQPGPGVLLGSIGQQGRPVMVRPGMLAGQGMAQGYSQGNPNDPASMVPRLPLNEASIGNAIGAADVGSPAGANAGQSENFIVLCRDPQLAAQVSSEAERLRRELAIHWLGTELPPWSRRCPIQVTAGPKLGAGGETRFALYNGNVGDWQMSVQGTPERILDSVLPHEITHTILASHFAPLNVHVPRWADEGACTTVEHSSEQNKHKKMLVDFMRGGRALPFNRMFTLKDYPDDILPLYAQGHSVVEFLISQSGPREFVSFLGQGMQTNGWEKAVRDHYGYETLGKLQIQWNKWIATGRGDVDQFAGRARGNANGTSAALASAPARARERGQVVQAASQVAEGDSVSLGNFTNIAQTSSASEVNLTASNAAIRTPATGSGGFYRKRLESNSREGQPATTAATTPSGSILR